MVSVSKSISAVFTEGLADTFKKLGYDVRIFTDYSGSKEQAHRGSCIIPVDNMPRRRSLTVILKLRKLLDEANPEVIILSLEYSFAVSCGMKATKIHFLHGFAIIEQYSYKEFITHYIINQGSDKLGTIFG